jgi:hypothetical protein
METPGASSSPMSSPPPPVEGFVVDDVPCRKCSYNLRTLAIAGVCPECGTPVGVSIYGGLLRYSDPAWLRNLGRGAGYILTGIFIVIVASFLGGFLTAARVVPLQSLQMYTQLVSFVGNIFVLIGSWLITEPDPSGIGEDQYGVSRKVIRVTLLLGAFNSLLSFVASISSIPIASRQPLYLIAGVLGIASVVGLFAQLQYFSKLAVRIPDAKLSERANFLKIALFVTYGLLIVLGIVMILLTTVRGAARTNPQMLLPIGCSAGVIGIAAVVFGVMYLFMLDRFRRAFGQQAALAEQIWAGHQRPSGPATTG